MEWKTSSTHTRGSWDSIVGIATRYGLEGPGVESRWGEFFCTYPDRLQGLPSLLYNGYRVFPGGKGGRGLMLTTHPLLVPRLRKSEAIPPLTLWVLLGLLRGPLYLYSYTYTRKYRPRTLGFIYGEKNRLPVACVASNVLSSLLNNSVNVKYLNNIV
jgi:hypothetical protein